MKKYLVLFSMLTFLFLWTGCSNEDGTRLEGTTKLEVRLTDAPAMYTKVNVEILGISVCIENKEGINWHEFTLTAPEVHNLLDYQNGNSTLIITDEIPAGKICEIRLLLGENNTVEIDGVVHKLTTPSAQQSGLKLKFKDELVPNETYRLWIDFDAGRSIHRTGNGKYMLKPVIRAFTDTKVGILSGTFPAGLVKSVEAILDDVVYTANVDENGHFKFIGLIPSDDWELRFYLTDWALYNLTGFDVSEDGYITISDINVPAKGEYILPAFTFTLK